MTKHRIDFDETALERGNGRKQPGLLVSVRSAAEALAALAGGADVIDVKEPARGSLGAADATTMASVVRAVNGRVAVTAAIGELTELMGKKIEPIPAGVSLFKIGLAGCQFLSNWRSHWLDAMRIASRRADPAPGKTVCRVPAGGINPPARETAKPLLDSACPRPVAVVYADWRSVGAPQPEDILYAGVEAGCPALLIDTCDKSAGSLFDHWPAEPVGRFVQSARAHGLVVVLAGSLAGENLTAAARLAPDLLAVRTAVCEGGRNGTVSCQRVRAVQQALKFTAAIPD
ncbi:MAG: (5-formylfuran-3-yl)methyl phosphate synthase, partial [Pirellulales bacterium]